MHELTVTQSILDLVIGEAQKQGANHVRVIRLKIGELTNVDPAAVEFYLEIIGKGTIAEGVKLEAERMSLTAECGDCKHLFTVKGFDFSCPKCEGKSAKLVTGKELYVESIEVE